MKPSPQSKPSRILVVDDEESVRKFAERALTDAGYEVVIASDGHQALRMAETQGPFDLFVLDLLMPMMNGDEVARLLRQADANVKVLYFTGYSEWLFRQTPTLSANEAFLEKPAAIDGLAEAVSLLLFGYIRP